MSPQRLEGAEAEYAVLQKEREELADKLAALQKQIAQATGRVEVSGDGIRRAVEKLQEQQEQLMLEEAGAQGRRSGLEQAIKEYTVSAADRASSDDAVKEYKKLVDIRGEQLQRLEVMFKQGAVPAAEVSAAEAAVAQAQADLAVAKQRAAGGTGPNTALDGWNREAMNLSIDQIERRARLEYIQSRLAKYTEVIPMLAELDRVTEELRATEARVDSARGQLDRVRSTYRAQGRALPSDAPPPASPPRP